MGITTGFTPFSGSIGPLNRVTPFTHRDNATFLSILQGVIKYINTTLHGEITIELERILAEAQQVAVNFEERSEEWQAFFDQFIIDVTANIAALNDAAIGDLVDSDTGDTYTAILALVNERATALTALSVPLTQRAVANGVATLDGAGKVPASQMLPGSLSGNYSLRPLASAAGNGALYFALDTKETYRSNGAAWALVGKGGYVGSASIVSVFDTPSIDLVDVPGLAVTFTAGSGIARVSVSGEAFQTVNNGRIIMVLEVSGESVGNVNMVFASPNTVLTFNRSVLVPTLVAGQVYTAKLRMMTHYTTGGYGNLDASPANPVTLTVESL